jgi:hypothetical protein
MAGRVETAVRAGLRGVEGGTRPADKGTAALALRYAAEIDEGGDLEKLGPLLLAALAAMLMTPAARAAAVKGVRDASTSNLPSPLRRLRDDARGRRAG